MKRISIDTNSVVLGASNKQTYKNALKMTTTTTKTTTTTTNGEHTTTNNNKWYRLTLLSVMKLQNRRKWGTCLRVKVIIEWLVSKAGKTKVNVKINFSMFNTRRTDASQAYLTPSKPRRSKTSSPHPHPHPQLLNECQ